MATARQTPAPAARRRQSPSGLWRRASRLRGQSRAGSGSPRSGPGLLVRRQRCPLASRSSRQPVPGGRVRLVLATPTRSSAIPAACGQARPSARGPARRLAIPRRRDRPVPAMDGQPMAMPRPMAMLQRATRTPRNRAWRSPGQCGRPKDCPGACPPSARSPRRCCLTCRHTPHQTSTLQCPRLWSRLPRTPRQARRIRPAQLPRGRARRMPRSGNLRSRNAQQHARRAHRQKPPARRRRGSVPEAQARRPSRSRTPVIPAGPCRPRRCLLPARRSPGRRQSDRYGQRSRPLRHRHPQGRSLQRRKLPHRTPQHRTPRSRNLRRPATPAPVIPLVPLTPQATPVSPTVESVARPAEPASLAAEPVARAAEPASPAAEPVESEASPIGSAAESATLRALPVAPETPVDLIAISGAITPEIAIKAPGEPGEPIQRDAAETEGASDPARVSLPEEEATKPADLPVVSAAIATETGDESRTATSGEASDSPVTEVAEVVRRPRRPAGGERPGASRWCIRWMARRTARFPRLSGH